MNSPLILAPSCPLLWDRQRWWERKVRAQFCGVAEMDKLDLPQQLIILCLSFQKHKSQAWIIWTMHFQSLLALHGLQEKSKGIMPWPGEQGAAHQELWGALRAVLNHSLGTALPHKPNSSTPTSAQRNPSTLPPQEDAGKTVPLPPPRDAAPTDSQGRKARHNKPPALLFPATASLLSINYSFQWHFHCQLSKAEVLLF